MNCKHQIFTLFEDFLTFAINYSVKMYSFIGKHFRNSFGTPVFLNTQTVNQTAFIVQPS